jgi:hypothetical protein
MSGDLCAIGGWIVTIEGTQKFGGYLVMCIPQRALPGRFARRRLSISQVRS